VFQRDPASLSRRSIPATDTTPDDNVVAGIC